MQITKYISALFLLIQLSACTKSDDDILSVCLGNKPSDSYVFPIVPGTAQWLALPTTADRYAACEIPAATVHSMSTEALIQSWFDYPFINDIFIPIHCRERLLST